MSTHFLPPEDNCNASSLAEQALQTDSHLQPHLFGPNILSEAATSTEDAHSLHSELPLLNETTSLSREGRLVLDALNKIFKKLEEQSHVAPGPRVGARTHTGPLPPLEQTRFGIPRQDLTPEQQINSGNGDYEEIFAEDAYGAEASPNARVFKVYNEETAVYDDDVIRKSCDSSDVLLVFAGLFSAVVTTFVAQTSLALEMDTAAISNSLQLEIVQLLRAQISGTSLENVAGAITKTAPTANDLWVNGLWFVSLALSLATALFAVLTKQWLHQYRSSTSGTAQQRSIIRQLRFSGMERWHVLAIIGTLPVLLHLALGLFLAGLIIFLFPRCLPLAYVVLAITIVIYSLYFVTNLLPVMDIQCPYRTPFSNVLNIVCYRVHEMLSFARTSFVQMVNYVCAQLHLERRLTVVKIPSFESLEQQEHSHTESHMSKLSLDVIAWLIKTSSNPSAHSVAVQAIGGLHPSQRKNAAKLLKAHTSLLVHLIDVCNDDSLSSPPPPKLERLARVIPILSNSDSEALTDAKLIFLNIYPRFAHFSMVQGMISSRLCYELSTRRLSDVVKLIHKTNDLKLSPCIWMSVFLDVDAAKSTIPEIKHFICTEALGSVGLCKGGTSDDMSHPISLSVAFSQIPELVLSVFRGYNPFENLSTASPPRLDPSLPPSGPSSLPDTRPPPDSISLKALLTLHSFLTISLPTPPDNLASVWTAMKRDNLTTNDCFAIFQAADLFLASDYGRTAFKQSGEYCQAVLESYHYALEQAGRNPLQSDQWRWSCLRNVAEISSLDKTRDACCAVWGDALAHNVELAYTLFMQSDVLGKDDMRKRSLVIPFISGLIRQRQVTTSLRPLPHPDWLSTCLDYLHQSDNLLAACKILIEKQERNCFSALARVDPDNNTWDGLWAKLREWCSKRTGTVLNHADVDSSQRILLDERRYRAFRRRIHVDKRRPTKY